MIPGTWLIQVTVYIQVVDADKQAYMAGCMDLGCLSSLAMFMREKQPSLYMRYIVGNVQYAYKTTWTRVLSYVSVDVWAFDE